MNRKYFSALVLGLSLCTPIVLPGTVWATEPVIEAVEASTPIIDARVLSNAGDFQAAAVPYAQAVAQDYENVELMVEAGINALAAGLIQSSLDYVTPVLKVEPANSAALHLMGQILIQKEELKRARNYTADALMFDANNITYMTTLVLLNAKLGDVDEAMAGAEAILKIDATNLDALKILARFYLGEKNVEMLEVIWDRIFKVDPSLENMAQYAYDLYSLKEKGKAEQVYRLAIQTYPNNYLPYAMFGDFLFRTTSYEEAARMFSIGAFKAKEPDVIAYSHGKMSRAFFKLGNMEKAKKEVITCLNTNPNEYEGLLTKAKLFLQANMLKEGRNALAGLQEQGKNDAEYYFALASLNNTVNPGGTEADELLALARQINPDDPEYIILEARRFLMVEDLASAESLVMKSLEITKGDNNLTPLVVQAYITLSDIYIAANDFKAAISIRENIRKAGLQNKRLDISLYEVYLQAGRFDDAIKHLSIFQDSLSKAEQVQLDINLYKAYVKTKKLDEAIKLLKVLENRLSKEEQVQLDEWTKKTSPPDDPEATINKQ